MSLDEWVTSTQFTGLQFQLKDSNSRFSGYPFMMRIRTYKIVPSYWTIDDFGLECSWSISSLLLYRQKARRWAAGVAGRCVWITISCQLIIPPEESLAIQIRDSGLEHFTCFSPIHFSPDRDWGDYTEEPLLDGRFACCLMQTRESVQDESCSLLVHE